QGEMRGEWVGEKGLELEAAAIGAFAKLLGEHGAPAAEGIVVINTMGENKRQVGGVGTELQPIRNSIIETGSKTKRPPHIVLEYVRNRSREVREHGIAAGAIGIGRLSTA